MTSGSGETELSLHALVGLNPADAAQSASMARMEAENVRLRIAVDRLSERLEVLERKGDPQR